MNSEYDDYNSDLPYAASRFDIYFSSNRSSNGNQFDIIGANYDISYHKEDNILNINTIINDKPYMADKLLQLANTDNSELGPYTFHESLNTGWSYLLFASEENGIYNIKFVYTNLHDWGHYNSEEKVYGPYYIDFLNSNSSDLYPTRSTNNEIYFCSNRDGNSFNIYKADMTVDDNYYNYFINTNTANIEIDTVLSSNKDDKCPSIRDELLVFASNRDGGYGGFDLWYSKYVNNLWTAPVNFGPKINSQYDEYRPITASFIGINYMIFSSNRPDGKGGFDLYCVKYTN